MSILVPLDVAVATSVKVTVVLARRLAYSVSVIGSYTIVPVWPPTTVVIPPSQFYIP